MAADQNTPGKSWIMTCGILKIIFGLFSLVVVTTTRALPAVKLIGFIIYGSEVVVGILACCFAGAQSTGKSLTLLILGSLQVLLYLFSSTFNFIILLSLLLGAGLLFGAARNFFASRE